jgi:hypothetical protein
MIYAELERFGTLSEPAPEGTLSVGGMKTLFQISNTTIADAISRISDQLGDVHKYRFGSRAVNGYTPEQQEMIYAELERFGTLSEPAPEGVVTIKRLAQITDKDRGSIKRVIDTLADQLSPKLYRFGSNIAYGYPPEDQALITQALQNRSRPQK